MKIHRPNPQILIVTKSRLSNIMILAFMIPFFCFWYFFLFGLMGIHHPIQWIFVLFPILFFPRIYKSLKIVVVGEQLSFDGVMRIILKNQKLLARFDEVEHLQIRTISGEGGEDRLTAVLGSGKKIGSILVVIRMRLLL